MEDIVLFAALALVFLFGWHLMKKLDNFLENNRQSQIELGMSQETSLRIGLLDPLVADSLLNILERYSRTQPNVSVFLSGGTLGELAEALSAWKLDLILLPEDAVISPGTFWYVGDVSLRRMPVIMKSCGMPIEPIEEKHILQKILCWDMGVTSAAYGFLMYMNEGIILPERQR